MFVHWEDTVLETWKNCRIPDNLFLWLFPPCLAAPLTCSEGQPHSGWGLWSRCLTGESTLTQCLAIIQKLVILRKEAGKVSGEAPGGSSPKDLFGQQLHWKSEEVRETAQSEAQAHSRVYQTQFPGLHSRFSKSELPRIGLWNLFLHAAPPPAPPNAQTPGEEPVSDQTWLQADLV